MILYTFSSYGFSKIIRLLFSILYSFHIHRSFSRCLVLCHASSSFMMVFWIWIGVYSLGKYCLRTSLLSVMRSSSSFFFSDIVWLFHTVGHKNSAAINPIKGELAALYICWKNSYVSFFRGCFLCYSLFCFIFSVIFLCFCCVVYVIFIAFFRCFAAVKQGLKQPQELIFKNEKAW